MIDMYDRHWLIQTEWYCESYSYMYARTTAEADTARLLFGDMDDCGKGWSTSVPYIPAWLKRFTVFIIQHMLKPDFLPTRMFRARTPDDRTAHGQTATTLDGTEH